MEFITKSISQFSHDVNQEDSKTVALFQQILTFFFIGTMWLGVPLMIYLITMMMNGF